MTYQLLKKKHVIYGIWCTIGALVDHQMLPDYLTSYTSMSAFILITFVIIHMILVFIYARFYEIKDERELTTSAQVETAPTPLPAGAKDNPYRRFRSLQFKRVKRMKAKGVGEKKGVFYSLLVGILFGALLGFGLYQWVIQVPNYLLRSSEKRCISVTVTKREIQRSSRVDMEVTGDGQSYTLNAGWPQPQRGIFRAQLGSTFDVITQSGFIHHDFITDYGPRLCQE